MSLTLSLSAYGQMFNLVHLYLTHIFKLKSQFSFFLEITFKTNTYTYIDIHIHTHLCLFSDGANTNVYTQKYRDMLRKWNHSKQRLLHKKTKLKLNISSLLYITFIYRKC